MTIINHFADMGFASLLNKVAGNASAPAACRFHWSGLQFDVAVCDDDPDEPRIALTAILGRLPFTAENALARREALRRLDEATPTADGAHDLTADGLVTFEASTSFNGPATAERFLEALVVSLLQIRPYLKQFNGVLKRVPANANGY